MSKTFCIRTAILLCDSECNTMRWNLSPGFGAAWHDMVGSHIVKISTLDFLKLRHGVEERDRQKEKNRSALIVCMNARYQSDWYWQFLFTLGNKSASNYSLHTEKHVK
jgi:hypothetical protein